MRTVKHFKKYMLLCIVAAIAISTTLSSCDATIGMTYQSYTPPSWAPPYDDVSGIHYYYFPDYDMYYDVWGNQFWYDDNGIWTGSVGLPPMYSNIDLTSAYIVLINKKYDRPWNDHAYY